MRRRDETVFQRDGEAVERTDGLACACQVVIEIGRSLDGLGIQDFCDAVGLKSVSKIVLHFQRQWRSDLPAPVPKPKPCRKLSQHPRKSMLRS